MDLTPGPREDQERSEKERPGWRSELTTLLAEQFARGNPNASMWVLVGPDNPRYQSKRPASPTEVIETIAPVIVRLLEDQGRAAYRAGREDAAKAVEDSDVIYAWQAVDVARGLQPQEEPWQRRAAATGGGPCPTCGKPFWTHVCLSCSPDYQTPGKGCHNCRNTGMDQTPCLPEIARGQHPRTPGEDVTP